MIVVVGIGAIVVSLWDKFSESRYRPLRAGVFVAMASSGIIPTVHFIYTDGMRTLIDENSFIWLVIMAVFYLVGAFLYATRTPERFFPGKCDIWFQSHQLFHLLFETNEPLFSSFLNSTDNARKPFSFFMFVHHHPFFNCLKHYT
uniref:Uncharacterized protein n=1 Tax=Panagrolaimus sp. PS1159 TaxID=55785 RepID=A0AC35EW02_9BILA